MIHKGVEYFSDLAQAMQLAGQLGGLVREYERGYAVQYWVSGPYYPEPTCSTLLQHYEQGHRKVSASL